MFEAETDDDLDRDQPPAASAGDADLPYLDSTRAPIYSLILTAPFLLVYHLGILVLPRFTERNAAGELVRRIVVDTLGAGTSLAGVLVLAAAFAAWQWRADRSLRVRSDHVGLAFLESFAWAFILYVIPWQLYRALAERLAPATAALGATAAGGEGVLRLPRDLVLSCGAGVYEEFVFRVILVSLIALAAARIFGADRLRAGLIAVGLGALLFSLAHHVGEHGDPVWQAGGMGFDPQFWTRFCFRTVAGVYFAALFYYRSFGVAVATHAMYNILVSVLDR